MTRQHAITQAEKRATAFGIAPDRAVRLAEHMADAVARKYHLSDFILIVAQSERKIWVGDSNGHYLCALVRDREVHTFLLRRKSQIRENHSSRLGNLRYFRVQGRG